MDDMDTLPSKDHPVDPSSMQIFRLLDLPAEIRNKIYALALIVPQIIDLDPNNYRVIAPRLLLFLTSRQVHAEAYPIFYGENTFRIFPLHTRFYYTDRPLLARLGPQYLGVIKTLNLWLGSGFNNPPRGWAVTPNLMLREATRVRVLKIFVASDPSYDGTYRQQRSKDHFYTEFAGSLVNSIFKNLAGLQEVELDGFPLVQKPSPLMSRLLEEARSAGKKSTWGLLRGWKEENGHVRIGKAMTDRDRDWVMVDLYGDESLDRVLKLLVM